MQSSSQSGAVPGQVVPRDPEANPLPQPAGRPRISRLVGPRKDSRVGRVGRGEGATRALEGRAARPEGGMHSRERRTPSSLAGSGCCADSAYSSETSHRWPTARDRTASPTRRRSDPIRRPGWGSRPAAALNFDSECAANKVE